MIKNYPQSGAGNKIALGAVVVVGKGNSGFTLQSHQYRQDHQRRVAKP